jgi:hypothetical protein
MGFGLSVRGSGSTVQGLEPRRAAIDEEHHRALEHLAPNNRIEPKSRWV